MEPVPCISQIATLLADPKRSAMLWALIDGTARGADELASLAGVSMSSAGAHLARLSAGGLLTLEARGRKRFFRLAKPEVGAAVEALACVSYVKAPSRLALDDGVHTLSPVTALHQARLCQDHLGGVLAADLFQRMVESRWLEHYEQRLEITTEGSSQLANWGIYTQALVNRERLAMQTCCDWSTERPHLGGALGASLMKLFLQSGWVKLNEDNRQLQVTRLGAREIARMGLQTP
ncbi:ArsR/SmtB family transcription factor [Pseudomonas sp. UBA4194]|jgi:DNA-binding transcriptional ArsR family regulator|uniref:ArsR/SmtB family transcription factor n=1 Tax=Pseudomonas sp. UBA4194 TaxID=1947317 RepID=UPI0025D959DC|nr:helix-turn-helix transcriptional regulator [Pseudomonas sp. UBA4194]